MMRGTNPRFTVLGAVRVHPVDGAEPRRLGSPQQQAMLAVLLLRTGHLVSLSQLMEALWGQSPPPTAASIVRKHAWQLRRALDNVGGPAGLLTSVGDGYRLTIAPHQVDALHAEELAAEARQLRAAHKVVAARARSVEALELWQGEPLAGVPGPFADRSRDRLVELRIALIEERWELELALAQPNAAIPALTEIVAAHPLRERSRVLLMRALYAAGRQSEALEVFADAQRLLVEQHGLRPGPELAEVHRRILEGEPAGFVRVGDETGLPQQRPEPHDQRSLAVLPEQRVSEQRRPPPPEQPQQLAPSSALISVPVPAQLPPDLPDFTGRATEISTLASALTASDRHSPAGVAITGMGGIGKTALGVHVAHQVRSAYPDGQLYVDLTSADGTAQDAGAVLGVLLSGLGVPAGAWPDGRMERSGLLRSLLDGQRVLIMLDNAWDPADIQDAIPGSASCGVLITSQVRMDGLPLTTELRLDLFQPDEALGLLGRSIGQDRIAADSDGAARLVATSGFLPLAIRILAARLAARPRWTLRALVERLSDERRRLAELRAGTLTVDATFDLGYQHLTADQARSFRLLAGVGPDMTPAEAAAVLGQDPAGAERALEGLVDAAMMESPAPGRYRYHALVHGYARQRALTEPTRSGRTRPS